MKLNILIAILYVVHKMEMHHVKWNRRWSDIYDYWYSKYLEEVDSEV